MPQVSGAGPAVWPLLGHLPAFHADSTGFLLRLAREQGDVARFRLGRREAILLAHPEHVRAVLVDRASEFTKGRLMQRARRLLGDGLLTSEGPAHHVQRRRIQPVFTRERLYQYAELIPGLATAAAAGWPASGAVRVDAEMDALAMSAITKTLLGADIEADAPELGRALRRLSRGALLLVAPGGRALERTRLPLLRRLREAIETVERAVDRQITAGAGSALLSALLLDGHGRDPMPPRLVRDEVMTIFLAGHDTTSAALTWTWLLLGAHPEVEARLHHELATVLGDREPRAADASCLPYTEMVVRETLRLYPPIGRIGRRPTRDVDLGGVVLPRDAAVFLSPFVTQRDPRWFPNPDEFRPERWADPAPNRPPFAWFPFGAGPRSCVGEHFARVVMVLVVAAIARGWRFRGAARLPKARSLLTLKPRGSVWMLAERRVR